MPRGSASRKTTLASEQARPDIARKRARWRARQGSIDRKRLVFIDETWAKTSMAPLRGWTPQGRRPIGHAPFGHCSTMTFIGALRHDGIVAPWVLDGPINGESFQTWVEQVLVPELRPDDIVVRDTLGSHKAPGIRRAIRAAGAKLFYPPPMRPTSTRSSRSSPSSSTCSAKPPNAPRKPSGAGSDPCSTSSPRRAAKPTSETQDMVPCKVIPL